MSDEAAVIQPPEVDRTTQTCETGDGLLTVWTWTPGGEQ